jgi:hypothetical protein
MVLINGYWLLLKLLVQILFYFKFNSAVFPTNSFSGTSPATAAPFAISWADFVFVGTPRFCEVVFLGKSLV